MAPTLGRRPTLNRTSNLIGFRSGHSVRRGERSTATHFALQGRERHVLFNDALNTFYLRLYGVRHMVKDHSDSEKGNSLPPHRLLLSINSKG